MSALALNAVSAVTWSPWLIIYGIVTIFPAPLAALLEKRVSITAIIAFGPIFQGIFAVMTTHTHQYSVFAFAGPMMAFTILFVHTFAFGLLARLDPTGRAVAGTPAMLMVGASSNTIYQRYDCEIHQL